MSTFFKPRALPPDEPDFLVLREESYEICYPEATSDDRRIQSLAEAVRSTTYRRRLGELPGYDSSEAGVLQPVS